MPKGNLAGAYRGGEELGSVRNGRREPLLGLSDPAPVPVNPSLMRLFQSRLSGPLRLKQSHKSPVCTLKQSWTLRPSFLTPWFGANGARGTSLAHRECHFVLLRADLTREACCLVSKPSKVAGAPRCEVVMGEGAISFGSQEKRRVRIAWLRMSGRSSRPRNQPIF
jgi:hypothetical protein